MIFKNPVNLFCTLIKIRWFHELIVSLLWWNYKLKICLLADNFAFIFYIKSRKPGIIKWYNLTLEGLNNYHCWIHDSKPNQRGLVSLRKMNPSLTDTHPICKQVPISLMKLTLCCAQKKYLWWDEKGAISHPVPARARRRSSRVVTRYFSQVRPRVYIRTFERECFALV